MEGGDMDEMAAALDREFDREVQRINATRRLVWVLLWVCGLSVGLAAYMVWMGPC